MSNPILGRLPDLSHLADSRWGLLMAPALGAMFVLAFPLVIFGAVGWAAMSHFASAAEQRGWLAEPRYQPAVAWLQGTESAVGDLPDELSDLVREVQGRRLVEQSG